MQEDSTAVTDFTRLQSKDAASIVIRCGRVEIASKTHHATCEFIAIANAITIRVEDGGSAIAVADFASAVGIDAGTVFVSGRGIEVACCGVRTACNFVRVTNTISIGVRNRNAAIAVARFAIAISEDT